MSDHSNGGEFFKGLFFGGIVGAVAALLYAPKSGKELREELRERTLELQDDAQSRLALAQERAEKLMKQTQTQLDELRKEAEAAVEELKESASGKGASGKRAVEDERGRIKDAIDAGVSAYKQEKAAKSKKA